MRTATKGAERANARVRQIMVEEVCGGGLRRREVTPAGAGITGVISGSRYAVAIIERDQPD